MKILLLSALALLMLSACGGGKKTQAETVEAADSTTVNIKEEIAGRIKNLYDAIAQQGEENLDSFACHTWWKTVAAVDEKDAQLAEIGFFNEDIWTMMQDSNPDYFEIRDIKFVELDVEKGTALVDFVLWSSIQLVHQKFRFCREDGSWRVHNIIRYDTDADGKETENDYLAGMQNYLAEPLEEASELTFENMDGIYDSLDENMNSESRICLHRDGTATWGMIGSLNYTEFTYTIRGNTICLQPKDVDSEEDCYEYDADTRTLKNEQGAVYYRQVAD
jgi:hypothetical protein